MKYQSKKMKRNHIVSTQQCDIYYFCLLSIFAYKNIPIKNLILLPDSSLLDGEIFTNLIQESFRHLSKATNKQVAYARAVVSQLLQLPNMKQSIVGINLVITKVSVCNKR